MVNELTQSLLDYTYETRNEATKRASSWLSVQLDDVRREAQEKQARVAALQRDTGVYSLGTTDAAATTGYSATLDQLQQRPRLWPLLPRTAFCAAASAGGEERRSGPDLRSGGQLHR